MRDSASVCDSGAGGVAVWTWPRRRAVALAAGLGFVVGCMTASSPASAQLRPGPTPDPIDHARVLSIPPVLTVPVPVQPAERLVPESRQRDTGTGQQIVIPPHYERPITDQHSASVTLKNQRPGPGLSATVSFTAAASA